MSTCDIIESVTGQQVTLDTPVEDLQIDSLEYLDLMVQLDIDSAKTYRTVRDMDEARP